MQFHERITAELGQLKERDRLRAVPEVTSRDGRFISIGGRRLMNLSSNDYLGLGDDQELRRVYFESCRSGLPPLGSSSSRLLTGSHPLYDELEQELAGLYGREAAMVFNSGYHANTGILPALAGRHDLVLSDRLNHASIIDGMKIADARWERYPHGDYLHLEELLEAARGRYRQIFIISESVFSMDGDLADLRRLVELKKRHDAVLIIDEAHGTGVFGQRGLGLTENEGVTGEVDIIIGTFGKALGSAGAYAVMDRVVRQYLVNTMRTFIFTTALPPVTLGWSLLTLRRQVGMQVERRALLALASRLRSEISALGFEVPGESHIVPVTAGADSRALKMAAALRDAGFLAMAVRPPSVPENSARVRISLRSILGWDDIAGVAGCLGGLRR
ncbi:aminotransferase class I/II-fold pyridoxal phosphate-dependent enzyme [Pelodictyon luteolum]|uniref:8-amino-7-oxononanoate synthase n=1 Tax=Chlorobium luteolum (strain DSM 273 / BCRC 81028 / 2530) TaxID=319225 RepID=Q3B170_CHLL3|nr:8-amino-7-oxononanoate synthase [Pelodictyon luteolum]ABB24911.1 8-amino-7-oxononanoate synthase [Pelodictyon luteolum DSM 273]